MASHASSTSTKTNREFSKDNTKDGFQYDATRQAYIHVLSQVYKNNHSRVVSGESTEIASTAAIKRLIHVIKSHSDGFQKCNAVCAHETLVELSKSYEVIVKRDKYQDILIRSRAKTQGKIVEVLGYEAAFDIICDTHRENNHCNMERLEKLLDDQYEIPSKCYEVFLECCNVCRTKQSFNKNVQVSIMHFPVFEENFCYIMFYKDWWTGYSLLRPLSSDAQEEISIELLKIYTDFGIPNVMHVPASQKNLFMASLEQIQKFLSCTVAIDEIIDLDSEEDSNKILSMMTSWMDTSSSGDWAYGCYEVQMKLNKTSSFNAPKGSPYVKVFGKLSS